MGETSSSMEQMVRNAGNQLGVGGSRAEATRAAVVASEAKTVTSETSNPVNSIDVYDFLREAKDINTLRMYTTLSDAMKAAVTAEFSKQYATLNGQNTQISELRSLIQQATEQDTSLQ